MKPLLALASLTALVPAATAQLAPIAVFTGSQLADGASEDFDSQPGQLAVACVAGRIFQNRADLCTPAGASCYLADAWSFNCTIEKLSGNALFGCSIDYAEIRFDVPVARFGGWFGCNSPFPDGTVTFFDDQDQWLATETYVAPADCSWNWNGWEATQDRIGRIEIRGNHPFGGYAMLEDLQVEFDAPTLVATPASLSVSAGGVQTMLLDAGLVHATLPYLLLGSASGSSPGIVVEGKTLPLNVDGYTLHTLLTPNAPPLGGSFGSLDATGRATATFTLPPNAPTSLVGLTATHAFVVLKLEPTLLSVPFVSEPATLTLIP